MQTMDLAPAQSVLLTLKGVLEAWHGRGCTSSGFRCGLARQGSTILFEPGGLDNVEFAALLSCLSSVHARSSWKVSHPSQVRGMDRRTALARNTGLCLFDKSTTIVWKPHLKTDSELQEMLGAAEGFAFILMLAGSGQVMGEKIGPGDYKHVHSQQREKMVLAGGPFSVLCHFLTRH